MYKNQKYNIFRDFYSFVSILVLMDLCIKTGLSLYLKSFFLLVSILVLMDLCIKTFPASSTIAETIVSILVLMDLCIKTMKQYEKALLDLEFQSLF